ncbi:MAG: Peptidyl-tRNA hydrolase [Candidatus Heimdallarchaeota archaeon LC_2]|nr:MAG: Peptidyl-tRNA hydrolase [Candidatus Heimdallarchaeota archaeon LC_2]
MKRNIIQIDEVKQVIVIRSDLNMGKGKIAAQAAHASVVATLEAMKHNKNWYDRWMREGMKKIAVKVRSEEELEIVFQKGSREKMPRSLINDAGHTQLEPGTATAVALGPAPATIIDPITKDLKLM